MYSTSVPLFVTIKRNGRASHTRGLMFFGIMRRTGECFCAIFDDENNGRMGGVEGSFESCRELALLEGSDESI